MDGMKELIEIWGLPGICYKYSDNEGNGKLFDWKNSFDGTATVDNIWLGGVMETGDDGTWCVQQKMYSYTSRYEFTYDHVGNNQESIRWNVRDTFTDSKWLVNGSRNAEDFWDAVGNMHSNGFAK